MKKMNILQLIFKNSNMTFELQQNIKNNAQDLKEYVSDLYEWEQQMEIKEKAKSKVRKQNEVIIQKQRQAFKEKQIKDMEKKNQSERQMAAEKKKQLLRDKNTVGDYYNAWDKFQKQDIDKQLQRLQEEETKPYKPYNPYEDSKTNIRAKPKAQMVVKGNRNANIIKDPTSLKDKGNLHFKVCEYNRAIEYYSQCLEKAKQEEDTEANKKLKAVVFSNRAMAYMKVNERSKALEDCNESLKNDDKYVKTYLRRADCLKKLGRYRQSLEDYRKIKKISDSQPQADIQIKKLQAFLQKRIRQARQNMIVQNIPEVIPKSRRLQIEEVDELEAQQHESKADERVQDKQESINYLEQL